MSWEIVKGHKSRIESIRCSIERGNLHHALLLSGPRGIGKSLVATCIAASLLCKVAPAGDFCGKCNVCSRIFRTSHPDVCTVKREEGSRFITIGEGDHASGNLLHSIRPLCELAYRKPFESDLKVFIVDEAEWIRTEAQDAFLKTLEEPPANTYFLLVCTNAQILKETIRSRTLLTPLHPLTIEESREVVQGKGIECDPELLDIALLVGQGSPGKTLSLLDRELFEGLSGFFALVSKLGQGTPIELSGELIDQVNAVVGGKTLEPLRDRLVFFFDAMLRTLESRNSSTKLPVVPDFLGNLSYEMKAETSKALLEAISDLRYNVRPQLVTDYLFERIDKYVRKG